MVTVVKEFKTTHECDAVLTIVADPKFLVKNLFPPIREVEVKEDNQFVATGRFMLQGFVMSGNVYPSSNSVTYVLNINGKGASGGKLVISCYGNTARIEFEYEGWLDTLASRFINSWFDNFLKEFDEKIRLERISRKI